MNGTNILLHANKIKNIISEFGINNFYLALMHIYKDKPIYIYLVPLYTRIKKEKDVIDLQTLNMLSKEIEEEIKKHTLAGLLLLVITIMGQK